MKDIKVQDAIDGSWVDTYAPLWSRPFLRLSRLDRPVGAWLLFLPCAFGAFLAGAQVGAGIGAILHVLIVTALGALLMRGAGCTWNDIVDRKIDAEVARTRTRPLPSGQVTVKSALIWMFAQMVLAGALLLTFRIEAILLTLGSLIVVAAYPFAKRFTHWPQIVLGLAFNWGVLTAWMQITGQLHLAAIALYLAMLAWTIYYDTIYAFQDIEDDVMIGVKSSAQATQKNPRAWLLGFIIAVALLLMLCAWIMSSFWIAIAFAVFIGLLERQRRKFDARAPEVCLKQFRENVGLGKILMAMLFAVYILAYF